MISFDSPWGATLETFAGRSGQTSRIGQNNWKDAPDWTDFDKSGDFTVGRSRQDSTDGNGKSSTRRETIRESLHISAPPR